VAEATKSKGGAGGTGEGPAGKVLLRSLEAVEGLWVNTLERAVNSKQIMGLGLRWLDVKLLLRRARQGATRRVLQFWGLPDASHTQEMLTLLQSLEERLLRLEDGLVDLRALAPEQGAVIPAPHGNASPAEEPAAEVAP